MSNLISYIQLVANLVNIVGGYVEALKEQKKTGGKRGFKVRQMWEFVQHVFFLMASRGSYN